MPRRAENVVVSGMPRSPRRRHDVASMDEIVRRAYEIFEERGRIHGHDLDDWLQAERELLATGQSKR